MVSDRNNYVGMEAIVFAQALNLWGLIISAAIGINEWLAPQISEHWP